MGFFQNLFGGKKEQAPYDLGRVGQAKYDWLKTDIHNHLLPGIDDGAEDVETSLLLLKRYHELGFSHVVATPHIRNPHHPNTRETIHAAWEVLENAPGRNEIPVTVSYSAEYHVDEVFLELMLNDDLMVFGGSYILLELSLSQKSYLDLENISRQLFSRNIQPVLAHPERYLYWSKTPEIFAELKQKGWLMQMNLMSILGYYGRPEQKVAEYLLKEDLVDFVGTDMHREKHFDIISAASPEIIDMLQHKYLINKLLKV